MQVPVASAIVLNSASKLLCNCLRHGIHVILLKVSLFELEG